MTGYWYPDSLLEIRKQLLDKTARPLFLITDFPVQAWHWLDETLSSRNDLLERNRALEHESLILQRKVLQMASLMAENARLNELLNSTETLEDSVVVAELLGVSPDPLKQEILLRRGSQQGVFEGQPVLDAYGLVGSVTDVAKETARVLLITDSTNAVPVQVNRNGVRGIAEGTGRPDELYIRNLVPTTDIHEGDLIVSSGLGGRYPLGYPVGEVVRIEYDGADSFLRVVIRPTAHLDRSRQFLLLYRIEAKLPLPQAPTEAPATPGPETHDAAAAVNPATSTNPATTPETTKAGTPSGSARGSGSDTAITRPDHVAPVKQ